jgi:hypothetical protein
MKVTVRSSAGIAVLIWRVGDSFHARRADAVTEPQICLGVDLFEVIAELGGLDLEDGAEAAEALTLAEQAQQDLAEVPSGGDSDGSRERGHQRHCS